MREAKQHRKTNETDVSVALTLDGSGDADTVTGVGFFDHMLTLVARHGAMDLQARAAGDLHVDAHHTVEDVGICLGKALKEALGDRQGITRYGHAVIPMDEALVEASVDVSGRPYFAFRAELPRGKVGEFDAELTEEFFRAVAMNSGITLHIVLRYGANVHHCIEGVFKAFARAMSQAVRIDPRVKGVPSSKGTLTG